MEITRQQQQLSNLIDERLKELDLPQEPSLLYNPVRFTLALPGKRVRPYLTLIGCGLCEGEIEEALPAALSIELLHNFTLLHDDIMDGAETRRGAPSVFKKWNANTAILSGDVMYAKAFQQLQYYGRNDNFSKESYHRILDIFLNSAEMVCEGQAYDLMFEKRRNVTLDEYLQMIEGKTAALLKGALAIGGAVAGADAHQIEELKYIGNKAGTAFQIQDDLLDAVGDPNKFGKKKGGDIIEGKKTYLTLLALQRCDDHQKDVLMNALSSRDVTEKLIDEVISIYHQLEVIEDAQKAIQYHYRSAIDHLEVFPTSKYKTEIIKFLNRLISREF